ncbi:hypothetical protein AKO1_002154 [Acrasis kona]|uniref:Stress-response A/B barrel domain-containing protein n=1 Tax=Acrasis kona TaxID=1008807 RepID=A0AAW2Z9U3_9EUKA
MSRQVEHVVFFKFDENALDMEKVDEILSRARKEIDGLLELNFGQTFTTDRAQGYTHALRARFVNKEALEKYGPHPVHQEYVAYARPLAKAPLVCLDWEV